MLKVHKNKNECRVNAGSLNSRIFRAVIWFVLLAGAVLMLYPLLWMIVTSLRSMEEVFTSGVELKVREFYFSNYVKALTTFPFFTYMRNTVVVAVFSVIFMCISCSLAGYGFARYKVPGSSFIFMLMLATMMLPGQVTMIPTFIIYKNIGWLNTLYPLFMGAIFGNAFNIFLMRQFFMRMSLEMAEAAKLDGCNDFQVWLKIYLPLAKPVLSTVAIFEFMGKWNDFMGPLIYINSDKYKTLALGLRSFVTQYTTDTNLLMAASLVIILPCIILFFCFQNYFISGITFVSDK